MHTCSGVLPQVAVSQVEPNFCRGCAGAERSSINHARPVHAVAQNEDPIIATNIIEEKIGNINQYTPEYVLK